MPRPAKTERNAEIIRMFSAGISQAKIAIHFGIVRGGVSRIIERYRAKGAIVRDAIPSSHPVGMRKKASKKDRAVSAAPVSTKLPVGARDHSQDARLIAEYIAMNGVKACPTVALNPTQAVLGRNEGINDRFINRTGWPASDRRAKRPAAAQ